MVEIKVNRDIYLINLFYSPRTANASVFDSPNKERYKKALDITHNIIILEDMNEDSLNPNMHNLKDVLLLNSLHNIISEPTRQLALLDPLLKIYGYIKIQIMNCLIKISEFNWACLHQGTVNQASSLFTNIFIEFVKVGIPSKTIVVREDDKP